MPDENISICICCKARAEPHKIITCCICKEHYLHSCVDLTSSEIRTIKTKGKGLSWTCKTCLQMGSDINDLKAAIIGLKNEFSHFKQQSVQQNLTPDDETFEEILYEFQERNKRRSNIIVYGLPESANTSGTVRNNYDQQKITEMLTFLAVSSSPIKVHRLGVLDSTKIIGRPIKVVFEREINVFHNIIGKAKNLKNSETWKNVGISLDRTQRQIKLYKTVKDKLRERLDGGENNITIKYIRGVPKIVPLNG